ncbi:MAG: hypothetical protein M2R45_03683 [Verrucomicrobia subdivision 3 bacterium]|nr:hypothetical protein [Limisphaerales bacterium]MCS1414966.1 hypothetical protein [Limisphaerales bacterium]
MNLIGINISRRNFLQKSGLGQGAIGVNLATPRSSQRRVQAATALNKKMIFIFQEGGTMGLAPSSRSMIPTTISETVRPSSFPRVRPLITEMDLCSSILR